MGERVKRVKKEIQRENLVYCTLTLRYLLLARQHFGDRFLELLVELHDENVNHVEHKEDGCLVEPDLAIIGYEHGQDREANNVEAAVSG